MSKIYLVRHAESIANTKGIYQGQTYDKGLSELGTEQAAALGYALKEQGIKEIISSPLKRTMQTAETVGKMLGLTAIPERAIIETNHGLWEGKDKKWISDNYPEIDKAWKSRPADTVFPQGESFLQTIERVSKFIIDHNWAKDTLLVTHDNIVRIIVVMSERMDMNDIWEIETDPAGITIIEVITNGEKKLVLKSLNNTEHLRDIRSNLKAHAL